MGTGNITSNSVCTAQTPTSSASLRRVPDLLLRVADVEVGDEERWVGALQHGLDVLAHVAEVDRRLSGLLHLGAFVS